VGHRDVLEEDIRNAYSTLVGNPEGKRQIRKPKMRGEDNIRMDLREIGWEGVWVWIGTSGRLL
jgi:hypothetical protein